jgi:alpha-glucosidase (family GH31 glycosyl hydrolase)
MVRKQLIKMPGKAYLNAVPRRCSFTFDPDNFPDPKAYLAEIKRKYGVKICVWSKQPYFHLLTHLLNSYASTVNPYISQLSPIFNEAVEGGYLIRRKDGTPWQ